MSKEAVVTEITDDIEIIGPGQMLADARIAMGLSQEAVAKRLNFRLTLVKDIEEENFDLTLPATYNRGYLKNYAKLVNVDEADVLSSFESLDAAKAQCAEMQSFSQQTKKQAHNNILMWITYLIIAAVIGSSAMWWLQGQQFSSEGAEPVTLDSQQASTTEPLENTASTNDLAATSNTQATQLVESASEQSAEKLDTPPVDAQSELSEQQSAEPKVTEQNLISPANAEPSATNLVSPTATASADNLVETITPSQAVFNFSGDCWVNIYDATGERIAWGIKKANYEMNITGIAPLRITLGKPELVQITFNGEAVDMSNFGRGNIAKFTLPLAQTAQ